MDVTTQQSFPQPKWWQAAFNLIWYDNTPVNVWDFQLPDSKKTNKTAVQDKLACLTDTPKRTWVDRSTLKTVQRAQTPARANNAPLLSYELFGTAHPEYCKRGSGATYNVATLLAMPHPILCIMKESVQVHREIVAQFALQENQIPYLHSFGLTPNYAVVVLPPLRYNMHPPTLLSKGLLPSMLHVNYTQVLVFDLNTGQLVANHKTEELVYFYHAISATEIIIAKNNAVSIKLCAYPVPDMITGQDHFLRFDRHSTPKGRNNIHPGGILCEIEVPFNNIKNEEEKNDAMNDNKENPIKITWTPIVDDSIPTLHKAASCPPPVILESPQEWDPGTTADTLNTLSPLGHTPKGRPTTMPGNY